jgi:cell division protein FtsN
MARDYKHRASQNKKAPQQTAVAWWKWGLIILLVALFAVFLFFLKSSEPSPEWEQQKNLPAPITKKTAKQPSALAKKTREPKFTFYDILSEEQVYEHEMNARKREERVGKGKKSKYTLQVGAFRSFKEADKLKAELALIGIESKIEKATVNNAIWNRVKIGPYNSPSRASALKERLKQKGIDVIVTEAKG